MSYQLAPEETLRQCGRCGHAKPESRFLVKTSPRSNLCDVCRKKDSSPKPRTRTPAIQRPLPEQHKLVQDNLRLCWFEVKRFARNRNIARSSYEDLFQEAVMGLMAAARAWDASRGIAFSTYACLAIRNRLATEIDEGGIISVPKEKFRFPQYNVLRDIRLFSELENQSSTSVDTEDYRAPGDSYYTLYLDTQEALAELPPQDRELLENIYFKGDTCAAFARNNKVPAAQIRTRLKEVLGRLRHTLSSFS